jgi:hypothetical protein
MRRVATVLLSLRERDGGRVLPPGVAGRLLEPFAAIVGIAGSVSRLPCRFGARSIVVSSSAPLEAFP